MPSILLIAPATVALSVAEALRNELRTEVRIATNHNAARAACSKQDHMLVVLDESFAHIADDIYQDAGTAPLLEVNFAISSAPRIVRQVRSALQRRKQLLAHVRAEAIRSLQEELKAKLAGLLLETQLALRGASPEQAPKLQEIVQHVSDLCEYMRA